MDYLEFCGEIIVPQGFKLTPLVALCHLLQPLRFSLNPQHNLELLR